MTELFPALRKIVCVIADHDPVVGFAHVGPLELRIGDVVEQLTKR